MTLAEYSSFDATALTDLVKRGEVSATELADLALRGVAAVNPQLNAVTEVYEERIAGADARLDKNAPFAGVPFLMKDLGAAEAGKKQELGSRLAQGRVAPETSGLTHSFKTAGLTPLGRTATPEFALSMSTESVAFGKTRNPWDVSKLAGGSSGGAGAIVAAGAVPLAHASDAAGSIRIPASACGLVGLKPSRGRVSSAPAGESVAGMNAEFALCRSVRDAAALLDAVSQPGVGDPFVIARHEHGFANALHEPLKPLRVAFALESWSTAPQDPVAEAVAAAVTATAALLETLGHSVERATPVFDYPSYLDALCVGWAYGFSAEVDELARGLNRVVAGDTLEAVTLSLYEFSKTLSVADLLMMDTVFNRVRRQVGRFFETYDLLLTPTLTRPPEPLDIYVQTATDVDFRGFFRRCDEACNHLPLANLTGQPALSLPLHQSAAGLPLGMQLMGRFGAEATLLRIARDLEQARPWHTHRPAVHVAA